MNASVLDDFICWDQTQKIVIIEESEEWSSEYALNLTFCERHSEYFKKELVLINVCDS